MAGIIDAAIQKKNPFDPMKPMANPTEALPGATPTLKPKLVSNVAAPAAPVDGVAPQEGAIPMPKPGATPTQVAPTETANEPAEQPPEGLRGANLTMWYEQRGLPVPAGANTGTGVLGSDGTIAAGGTGTNFSNVGEPGAPGGDGSTAWKPTDGIVDQIRGITPQTIEGSSYTPTTIDPNAEAGATGYGAAGYTATKAPDAEGYNPEGYDAETVKENLSGAIGRITGEDGIIMQRAKALADQQSNARGLQNSSMAVGAAQGAVLDKAAEIGQGDVNVSMFNADATNSAKSFLANAKNAAAQFLAAEKNNNGRFNAEQANQASAFTANASNQASQFAAAAQNAASMFNAGEANKRALASAEFANQAKMFAAQMEQAAKEFNATAFNQAQQRYADAMNAALAAQNDAENLARRDTAQINADLLKTKMGLGVQQQIASSNNATSMGIARVQQETQLKSLDQDLDKFNRQLAQQGSQFQLQLSQQDRQFVAGLSASQFNQFQQGLNAGMLTEMEPEARQNWMHNYMSVWSAGGGLNFNIDMSHFPPSGGTANPPEPTTPGTGTPNPVGR